MSTQKKSTRRAKRATMHISLVTQLTTTWRRNNTNDRIIQKGKKKRVEQMMSLSFKSNSKMEIKEA